MSNSNASVGLFAFMRENAWGFSAGAVAGRQFGTIKSQRPISNVQPCAPAGLDFMGDSLAFFEADTIDIHVLMDRCRSVTAIGRDHQHLGRLRILGLRMPFSVTRRRGRARAVESRFAGSATARWSKD